MVESRSWGWAVCAGIAGTCLLSLMARDVIAHAPHYDELLHVLSARGIIYSGAPIIADGEYVRAQAYTRLVAWSYELFGDSLVSARLPALAAGAALVFLMGLWVTRRAGFLAGAATAILICVVPSTLDVAVFARFYTLHALAVAVTFLALFQLAEPGRSLLPRVALVAATLALLLLAWTLQETTVIAAGAGMAGLLAVVAHDRWLAVRTEIINRPAVTLLVVAAALSAALLVAWYVGLLDQLRTASLWAGGNVHRPQYYIVAFRQDLPLMWPLFPVAALVAVVDPSLRRLAVFCLVVVLSAFLVHSIAAQKTMRYVYYLVPWMSAIWALAVVRGGRTVLDWAGGVAAPLRSLAVAAVLCVLGLVSLFSVEGARTLNLLGGRIAKVERLEFKDEPDWAPIVGDIAQQAVMADRVVTSNSMKALYYLGRYDYELNATIVPETVTHKDFGNDDRTGRPAIGRPESIERVLNFPGTTLIVLEEGKIGRGSAVSAEAFDVIEARCSELSLNARVGVRAWWCERLSSVR